MAYKVPVGGVFAAIYYEFEDGFQVYGNSTYGNPGIDEDYYFGINKMLGQGVKITGWRENNNVNLIRGLNNIEAANATDGPYEGELSVEFDAVGTLDWMEALMGTRSNSETYGSKVYEYTKAGIPKSMTFVIMIQNDSINPHGGDVFVLKGVIMKNVEISVEGTNVPVHVRMTCPYAKSAAYTNDHLPAFYTPTDNAFNFGQAVAYFWDPITPADPDDPASFDSFETVCEQFNMTIDHGAELIYGVGSRIARDKFHKYLDYVVTVKAYYRDKERFLEKFYGCREGPINDTVPAFKRLKLVVQNCKTCGDAYRRLEFEFETAKMNTRDSTIDIEDAITETYEFKPLHATIRAWNGEDPEAEFHVAPLHIKQGDLVAMHGKFYPRNTSVSIYSGTELIASLPVNCSGEFEYRIMADPKYDYWDIGNHTLTATAYSGSDVYPENTVSLTQTVFVTAEGVNAIPRISICPNYFSENTNNQTYGPINVKGYNFGTYGETGTAILAIYCGTGTNLDQKGAKVWPLAPGAGIIDIDGEYYGDLLSYMSGTLGSFDYTTETFVQDTTGVSIVEVNQYFIGKTQPGYTVQGKIYIAGIGIDNTSKPVRVITGSGLKPNERSMLYIEYLQSGTGVMMYKGTGTTNDYGIVEFSVTVPYDAGLPTRTTQIKQNIILTDGSGQLMAVADLNYPA